MRRPAVLVLMFFIWAVAAHAAAPGKPTLVIVHGAWGGAWQFAKIAPLLEQRGYAVHRVTLTGLGERSHLAQAEIGLTTHIEDVVNVIRFENLQDIILLGHSYGGMVITGVADRLPERIARLVYLDAMLPESGESALDLMSARGSALADRAEAGFIAPWWVRPDKPFPKDVPHPLKTLTEPLVLTNPAVAKVPGLYLLTVEPGQPPEQDDFWTSAERARTRGWPILQLTGDHNPQWRQPEVTAAFLHDALQKAAD
jgi:pimeloyl-ACP methyl ester carboxylesterase